MLTFLIRKILYRGMVILWPSFLMAAAATGLFFSAIDPHDLILYGAYVPDNRMAAYTVGFLLIWTFTAIASMLTYYLHSEKQEEAYTRRFTR
ncbi:hypothetical protein [Parvibium lacunae]|nr:hypothetical protein [Parvibium lacunae]